MEKAVLYLRVSSKGQEDGYSLDAQEKLGKEYAQKHNLEIVRIWRGSESAWGKKKRCRFIQMLDYVKKHSEVKHVIFDILDRMTRNDFDKIRIKELINEYGKTIHFSRTNKVYNKESNPDDEFMMDIEVAVAKKMSNDISRKTTMGMTEKAEEGIYPSNTPLGYLNKEGKVELDPINAPLIKMMFQQVASGAYSLRALEDHMFALGLRHKTRNTKVRKSTLYRILKNPFYYGEFIWGKKRYQGTHTPLVSKTLWEQANAKLSGNHRPYVTKKSFAFKGLLRCGHCDCTILGQHAKGKSIYYRCSFSKGQHKHAGYLLEDNLAAKFASVVDKVVLPAEITAWLQEGIAEMAKQAESAKADQRTALETALKRAETKLSRLYDLRLEGTGNQEMLNVKEQEINAEIARIQQALQAMGTDRVQIVQRSTETLEIVSNLGTLFQKADNFDKAKILRMLGENFVLDEHNDIQTQYRMPFNFIAEAKEKELRLETGAVPTELLHNKTPELKSSRDLIWGG